MSRRRTSILAFMIVALTAGGWPSSLMAWNKPGHMVVAAIAYRELQRTGNQAVIDKVVATLKSHPDFDTKFAHKLATLSTEDERNLYLFMLAARWPDDIRMGPTPPNDKPAHFIDNPFVPPGMTGVTTVPPASDNILTKFQKQIDIINNGNNAADDAQALCWLMHLAGDSHQPLHAVTMFTQDFTPPSGDRGGNEVFVKVDPDSHTINLHALWDGLILGTDRFQSVRNRASGLIGRPDMTRSTFPQVDQKDIKKWTDESLEFAKKVAYQDGAIQGSGDKDDGDTLPDHYTDSAKSVAERQVVLAGYRLADLLIRLAGSL
jgi:S1/P1 Nuclease